jgi:hypothetical protein
VALKSGSYLVKVEKEVVIWPAPDANGDGEEVWVGRTDEFGREIERMLKKDEFSKPVRAYHPPEGFANRPGYDHQDNYVKVDGKGNIVRQPNGEAIVIKPGQALVFNADGSVEVLKDEYSQYQFANAHDSVSGHGSDGEE